MKTLTLSSWKGGTGKTTLATVIAETLVKAGKRVLIIDVDPNCSISETYGKVLCDANSKQLYFGIAVNPYIVKENGTGKLGIIPSDLDIALMANMADTTLKNQIQKAGYANDYDFCIIDPPGNWCAHTRNAIYASDRLIITGTCSALDFRATQNYFEQLVNCGIEIDTSIVVNRFNARANQPGILEQYQESFKDFLFPDVIPDIRSLRLLTSDPNYILHPSVQSRFNGFIQAATGLEIQGE